MLNQIQPDKKLLSTLESSWRHMVTKRMFVTGGIGQLPYTEGFDSDYQLDPEFAYCESCAGIGSLLWNWQMTQITCDSAYSDLFEWQLYNAVLPGLSSDGKRYVYRTPLEIKTPYGRKEWYIVACCPPNISRTIASLGEQILTYKNNEVWIHQYFTSQVHINEENEITCILESGFPFNGDVKITITNTGSNNLHIYLRTPSWAKSFEVILNEKEIKLQRDNQKIYKSTASGYNPFSSFYIDMTLESKVKNEISLKFAMPITIIKPDSRVKTVTGKATIARGPIVYCLEDTFNEFDIFSETIIEPSLQIDKVSNKILGKTKNGQNVVFTPYINWATIKDAKMTVFTKIE